MEENRIPKRILYMNFETRPRGRTRNRWQDEVRQNGRNSVKGKESSHSAHANGMNE
jgi:hypothetical protein